MHVHIQDTAVDVFFILCFLSGTTALLVRAKMEDEFLLAVKATIVCAISFIRKAAIILILLLRHSATYWQQLTSFNNSGKSYSKLVQVMTRLKKDNLHLMLVICFIVYCPLSVELAAS